MKIRIVSNGCGKKIHEMQIFKWINDILHLLLPNIRGVVANCSFVVQLSRVCSGFRWRGCRVQQVILYLPLQPYV